MQLAVVQPHLDRPAAKFRGNVFQHPVMTGDRDQLGVEFATEDARLFVAFGASQRPATLEFEPGAHWLGLAVRSHRVLDADHAEVEFVARYRVAGRAVRLHECSRFVREAGRWYYVDGDSR